MYNFQLFTLCGEPKFESDRKKRNVDQPHFSRPRTDHKLSNPIGRSVNHSDSRHTTEKSRVTDKSRVSLDGLVRDIRRQIETAKDFWRQLVEEICTSVNAAAANTYTTCWNGQKFGR